MFTAASGFEIADLPDFSPQSAAEEELRFTTGRQRRNILETGALAVGGTLLSTADTFAESFGILDENDMEDFLKHKAKDVGQFFEENRDGLAIAGDILGSFIPGALAVRAVRGVGVMGKLYESAAVKALGSRSGYVLSTGKRNEELFQEIFQQARVLAGDSKIRNFRLAPDEFKQARAAAMRRSVGDVVLEDAAASAAIIATMNSSDLILPPDSSLLENIAFFGIFNAAFGAAGYIGAHATMQKGIQNAVRGVAGRAQNPGDLPLLDVQSNIVGERGPAMAVVGAHLQQTLNMGQEALQSADSVAARSMAEAQTSIEKRYLDLVNRAGQDSPLLGVTESYSVSAAERKTMLTAAKQDSMGLAYLRSVEDFVGVGPEKLEGKLQFAAANTESQLIDMLERKKQIASGPRTKKSQAAVERINKDISKKREQLQELQRTTTAVYEIDGSISSTSGRLRMFQDGRREIVQDGDNLNVEAGGIKISVDASGELRVPSTFGVVGDELPKEALTADANTMRNIRESLGVKNEAEMLRTVVEPLVDITPTEQVRAFRSQLPVEPFTAYRNPSIKGQYATRRTNAFSQPVTLSRENVWGISKGGRLIADIGETRKAGMTQVAQLSYFQRTATQDVMQRRAEKILENFDDWEGMTLRSRDSSMKFDLALKLVREADVDESVALAKVGVESLEELEMAALNAKFYEFQILRNQARDARAVGTDNVYEDMNNVAKALNLPDDNHPLLQLFEVSRVEGDKISSLPPSLQTKQDIEDAIRQVTKLSENDPVEVAVQGAMMNLPRDQKPVLATLRASELADTLGAGREELMALTLHGRTKMLESLRQSGQGSDAAMPTRIVSSVLREIESRPEMLKAIKDALPDIVEGAQVAGNGKLAGSFTSQAFRLREVPGAATIDTFSDITDRIGQKVIDDLLQETVPGADYTFQTALNKLLQRNNAGDLAQFRLAHNAYSKGWDVKQFLKREDGLTQIVLKNTQRNRRLHEKLFPDIPIDKSTQLVLRDTRTGSPFALSPVAAQAYDAMTTLTQQLGHEVNALRKARGLKPLNIKQGHLPPPNLSKGSRVYLLDSTGAVRQVVHGNTTQQAEQLAAKEIASQPAGSTLTSVSEASVERYFEARGQAFFEPVDFSTSSRQDGGASTGRSVGGVVDTSPAAYQDTIESLLRGYRDAIRETRLTVFEPEMAFLRMQKEASGQSDETVYDLLAQSLLGTQGISNEKILGRGLLAAESMYDNLMGAVYDKVLNAGVTNPVSTAFAKKQYNQFQNRTTPEFSPFKSFDDFMANTGKVSRPPTLRQHAALLNEVTTALSIRMFDIGMGVVNLATLASTLPMVVKMTQRRNLESTVEHLERIGAHGSVTPGGHAYISPAKVAATGMHFFFSKEGAQVAERAAKLGYFEQQAAETVRIFGGTGESGLAHSLRYVSDKVSFITDTTERLARSYSFMTMYKMGKDVLDLKDEAAMAFAHRQANNTIADFRPSNRPIMYQGAAGMPLGLFTTFLWNYLQRTYSAVESRQFGALANQFGLHSFLFGAEGLPGADEFINNITANYDGSRNITDQLNEGFGHDATEVLMNGTVSLLSSGIFKAIAGDPGLDVTQGISIGPRAGIGLPFERGLSAQAIPGVQMVSRLWRTGMELVDTAIENHGLDPQQAAQVLAQSNINKGLTSAIEIAQNYSTDWRGNIIEEEVRNSVGLGTRALGFKPVFADSLRQENVRNRTTDRIQKDLKARLANSLKNDIRGGRLSDDDVERALGHYIRAGGNPENFVRFFHSQVLRGTTSKVELEIAKALQKSNDDRRLARLLFLANTQ